MRGRRTRQTLILSVLLVVIISLTVGFASFTSNLKIKTNLAVRPGGGELLIRLSSSENSFSENDVNPIINGEGVSASKGKINNSEALGPTINNMNIVFNDKSNTQSVSYKFYIRNDGEYNAYLTDILFLDNNGGEKFKTCSPKSGGTQAEADAFCKNLNIEVKVGDTTTSSAINVGPVNHLLSTNTLEEVLITVSYNNSVVINEPVVVNLGKIEFTYSAIDNTEEYVSEDRDHYTPTSCFTTQFDSVNETITITDYDSSCSKDVVIPSKLHSYIVETDEFNMDACRAYVSTLVPESYIEQICLQFQDQVSSMSTDELDQAIEFGIITEYTIIESENKYPVVSIEENAFLNNQLTSVEIPNSVISIGKSAFCGNQLTSVEIPNSVTSIGEDAFSHNQLKNIIIPDSITSIEARTFNANRIESIIIPNGVTNIGEDAFQYNMLSNILLPDSITRIERSAFAHNLLRSVTIGTTLSNIKYIGVSAFSDTQGTNIVDGTIYGPNGIENFTIYVDSINKNDITFDSYAINWVTGGYTQGTNNLDRITWRDQIQ